jgi:hypothetical protein
MTIELGVEDSGAIPQVVRGSHIPYVRDKEDVPHEHALPDLYSLGRGFTVSEFGSAIQGDRRLRAELLELIDQCTEVTCTEDDRTDGLLIVRTRAHSKRRPRAAVAYVDVIISDQASEEVKRRVRSLLVELHGDLMVEVERATINRPHPQFRGSTAFKFFRYAKAVLA